MAVIDNKSYKLNYFDNNKMQKIFYNCAKDEESCKKMIKHLEFYDREEYLKNHLNCLFSHEQHKNIDLSKLTPINLLNKGERFEKIVPLDLDWLGILVSNKSGEILNNKVIYISNEFDGYVTDEIEPLLNGCVPESVYLTYRNDNPTCFFRIDDKYKDGKHDEFLFKLNKIVRNYATKMIMSVYENIDMNCKNKSVEEMFEFSKKLIKTLDFNDNKFKFCRHVEDLYYYFDMPSVIEFEEKYKQNNNNSSILGE